MSEQKEGRRGEERRGEERRGEERSGEDWSWKRIRPRAKGSASPINKRTSHITVVLEEN